MVTLTPPEGPKEFTCFLSLGGPFELGYVCIDNNKSEFLAFMSSGKKILHVPAQDIRVIRENGTLPSSLTVTLESSKEELVITHLLNKGRLVRVFEMMGKWQEDSESIESSPSPCTPDKDQSGMNEGSLATVDLESPPGSPKAKPHPVIPLPDQEPEDLFPTPNEVTTDPKLAQLHDIFPEEDIEKLSNLLRGCGGDVTRAVDAMLSARDPNVPQERKFHCKELFQKYQDRFLERVSTHAIANLLEIKKVIPESLCFQLGRTSNDEATQMLYRHMRDHGSLETVHRLCDVMIKKEGFPKMNSLGQDMKEDLPILKERKDQPVNFVSFALHNAVASGNISEVETVVQKYRNMPDFDVDCLFDGCTPLHTAAKSGYVDIVEKLVELRCDMSKTDDNGLTALHYAAVGNQVEVVAKLIELKCDMNKTDNNGYTALHYAALKDNVNVVKKLVALRCDMDKTVSKGWTALHVAAILDHVDVVAKLVELGCDMNKTDDNGLTALHHAAMKGHVDVVTKLNERGCDMSKTDIKGWTALHYAAEHGCVDVAAKLVELGCDVNERDIIRNTALHIAAAHGHVKVVTKLIELECDMNATSSYNGATALHMAAVCGHVDVVTELVDRGMDVNKTSTDGMTALHLTAQKGHVNAMTKLIVLGCDRNKTNTDGHTALDIAKAEGHKDIVAKLIIANLICWQGKLHFE